jgi:hypothetical protein
MNAYNEISNILSAMGANPAITKNGVKVNAPTINGFTFDQLSGAAKENARQWYINQYDYLERFQEDYENELSENFPGSDLKIALSWLCCQGDGVNVSGRVYLEEFLPFWDASEKEKRTMRFYCSKGLYYYDFTGHNRYSYSCKFMDIDAIDETVDDFIYHLPDLRNINAELIKRFFSDMFDYFDEYDSAIYDDLYNYIYNPSDNDISDFCDANEIYFDVDGRPAQ